MAKLPKRFSMRDFNKGPHETDLSPVSRSITRKVETHLMEALRAFQYKRVTPPELKRIGDLVSEFLCRYMPDPDFKLEHDGQTFRIIPGNAETRKVLASVEACETLESEEGGSDAASQHKNN